MNKLLTGLALSSLFFTACAQDLQNSKTVINVKQKPITEVQIDDYFNFEWKELDYKVNTYVNKLSPEERVAQLIMPAMGRLGQPEETIRKLVAEKKIGGILMLNGTGEQFKGWINEFNTYNRENGITPFFYSADAEPSLVNRKILGSTPVKKASEITSIQEVIEVAKTISTDLNTIGINYNFAPVSDMSANGTVGYRGFGKDPKNIVPFSMAFVEVSSASNVLTSIKHFPGHGLVSGDTHKALQAIDGELKELEIFKELIAKNVPSVMIGHLAIINNSKYDTDGLPATVSSKIVNGLLRTELGYKGLVVTDAMNMGGVVKVPNNSVKAIEAGVDILLMPVDADKAYTEILSQYKKDPKFAALVDQAVVRIIRMKVCQQLIK